MTSKLFPELNTEILHDILWNNASISEDKDPWLDAVYTLEELGILQTKMREFTKCVNPRDEDFHLPNLDRHCDGEIDIDNDFCPNCGRPVDQQGTKQRFKNLQVRFNYDGIRGYLGEIISNNSAVVKAEQETEYSTLVELVNEQSLRVVLLSAYVVRRKFWTTQ